MTEAERKKKKDEQRELEGLNPASPSSGSLEEARAIAEQVEKDTGIPQGTPGYNYHKDSNGKWVAGGLDMPETMAEAAKDIVVEDPVTPYQDGPDKNNITWSKVYADDGLKNGVKIPENENPAEGLKPISLPDLKAVSLNDKEEQTKTSESQSANATPQPEDGYPASLAEYRKKLMDQEAKDMQSIADLEKENETREKRAKWTKAFASIGDAVSGIANLVGTAHWGKSADQSSMTSGIHSELKDARDRYTKNVDDIRRRLSSTREGILKSYKDELSAKQAQGLDMKESEFNEMMQYRWEDLQYKIDRLGVERALQEERINLQRQAEERKGKTAEDNAAKKAESEARDQLRGKWQSIASEAKKTLFGGKAVGSMTADERMLYNRISGAKSKNDIDTLINEFENDPRMKPYLDSLRGQSATSETPSAPSDSTKTAPAKKSNPMGGGKKKNPMS